MDKLKQIGGIASNRNADAVLDNGDFFHKPGTKNNSHELVRRVVDVHDKYYDCPVYENPGNHDFPYTKINYVEKHALGVLFSTGVFREMDDIVFEDDDGLKVRVVGIPYKKNFEILDFDIERGDEDVLIAAGHTFASPEGAELWGDDHALSYFELADCTPDFFIFGHWHIDQGIQTVKGKQFMNLGSMTRGSLVKDNLDRTPRVGYVEIGRDDEGGLYIDSEAIELDVKPASEVFDLKEYKRTKHEEEKIDQFISSLSKSSDEEDENSITDEIDELDFSERVKEKAFHYLNKSS
jgi:DNA repair exonuclease SbcCD nuclease subunit